MKKKIQDWRTIWLNLQGKFILIKSILASYPIFSCVNFLAPKSVINILSNDIGSSCGKVERLKGKKFNMVTVLEDKCNGGLGIRDLVIMNNALGEKLVWRMVNSGKD